MRIVTKTIDRLIDMVGWAIVPIFKFPVNPKKIVISSYFSRGYSDNPKAVVDELISRDLDYDYVFISNQAPQIDSGKGYRFVRSGSLASIFHLYTAKIWIDNCRKSPHTKKRSEQYYMQTWHGHALKRIEADVDSSLSHRYIRSAINDSKMCDIIISDSSHMTDIYKTSFWYDGDVITCGLPRADILSQNNIDTDDIRNTLNIPLDKKTITYAPTFRGDKSLAPYDIDYKKLTDSLTKRFGGEWVVLLRLHPNIASASKDIAAHQPSVIDVSGHHDPEEVLLASDALITDYSSIMFDFMITGKPGFLYANDIEAYVKDRNFYFDIHSLPYSLATTNHELMQLVSEYSTVDQQQKIKKFHLKTGFVNNGNASKVAADTVERWMSKD